MVKILQVHKQTHKQIEHLCKPIKKQTYAKIIQINENILTHMKIIESYKFILQSMKIKNMQANI